MINDIVFVALTNKLFHSLDQIRQYLYLNNVTIVMTIMIHSFYDISLLMMT